jgi:uncharacterized protein YfaQ (DUF2300 family)
MKNGGALRATVFCAALLFVFANFGIAIAAKMPMITTTMSSSIRVKADSVFADQRIQTGW